MKEHFSKPVRLDWDSDFFEIEVGKLEVETKDIKIINQKKFDLIYVFSNTQIEDSKLNCYDKKITYSKKVFLTKKSGVPPNHYVKKYSGELTMPLLQLTLESGMYSRFKIDPKLSSSFEKLYTIWIQNSLSGSIADHVFIYEKNNEIQGFITLKKHSKFHQIGLVATSSTNRGIGIGSLLLNKVEEIVLSEGGNEIKVVTQLDNNRACNFYKKNGYLKSNVEYIYHLWLK